MSNKSKRPRKWSRTAQINSDLLVFFWAWVSKTHPDIDQIREVMGEVVNVSESLRAGRVSLDDINRQLADEFGIMTDWARRDRG